MQKTIQASKKINDTTSMINPHLNPVYEIILLVSKAQDIGGSSRNNEYSKAWTD